MKRSKWLWRSIAIVSTAATLLLLAGFVYATDLVLNPRTINVSQEEQRPELENAVPELGDREQIQVVALGDSLTRGTGDSTGGGYVRNTIELLQQKWDKPVELANNLAIKGLRADELAAMLAEDAGVRYAIKGADLILFSIGGNDLFQFANEGASSDEAVLGIDPEQAKLRLEDGLARLQQVIGLLDELAPDARVVYVGLYNPFYDVVELRQGSVIVQEWNSEAHRMLLEHPNMGMVPTFDLFEQSIGEHLSTDHFHPNTVGYVRIAERIAQAVR